MGDFGDTKFNEREMGIEQATTKRRRYPHKGKGMTHHFWIREVKLLNLTFYTSFCQCDWESGKYFKSYKWACFSIKDHERKVLEDSLFTKLPTMPPAKDFSVIWLDQADGL